MAYTRKQLEGMTVDQLKDELRKHGAKVSGRKAELVDRLVSRKRVQLPSQPDVRVYPCTMQSVRESELWPHRISSHGSPSVLFVSFSSLASVSCMFMRICTCTVCACTAVLATNLP